MKLKDLDEAYAAKSELESLSRAADKIADADSTTLVAQIRGGEYRETSIPFRKDELLSHIEASIKLRIALLAALGVEVVTLGESDGPL